MKPDLRVSIAAEAMWANRAKESQLKWGNVSWREFEVKNPDIAKIYIENAQVAIDALDRSLGACT